MLSTCSHTFLTEITIVFRLNWKREKVCRLLLYNVEFSSIHLAFFLFSTCWVLDVPSICEDFRCAMLFGFFECFRRYESSTTANIEEPENNVNIINLCFRRNSTIVSIVANYEIVKCQKCRNGHPDSKGGKINQNNYKKPFSKPETKQPFNSLIFHKLLKNRLKIYNSFSDKSLTFEILSPHPHRWN